MVKYFFILLTGALLLASCSRPRPVVVGSMNGTEQRLLGEIVAQHLERQMDGVEIRRHFAIGDTPILYQAILAGQWVGGDLSREELIRVAESLEPRS